MVFRSRVVIDKRFRQRNEIRLGIISKAPSFIDLRVKRHHIGKGDREAKFPTDLAFKNRSVTNRNNMT